MTVKELGQLIKTYKDDGIITDQTSIGISVKKSIGESKDPIIYVSDEDKIFVAFDDDILWIDGEFSGR